ncbi:MAG TPA: glycosyltransferase family 2 protein [Steroidobacteraceae bacterium]
MAPDQNVLVSAIIPAHNECQTICGVIAPLVGHSLIGEIIVVDDGSTDDTARRARSMGATVISLPRNRGKASAMSSGVHAARNEIIFFCDADVVGLTPETVTRIVTAVASGDYGMYVGIRGRKTYWANRLLHFTPILGGERALTRTLWNHVPRTYKKNFQIEIALNFFAKHLGQRMGSTVVQGLSQVIKEKKRGFWSGLWQRLSMIFDIVVISWRIYVALHARLLVARLRKDAGAAQMDDSLRHESPEAKTRPS